MTQDEYEAAELAQHLEYVRKHDIPRPRGMVIDVEHTVDGPAHDPYGVDIIKVVMPDGGRITLRMAEFTPMLVIDDGDVGRIEFTSEYEGPPSLEDMFVSYVGFTVEQVMFWHNVDEELHADVRHAEMMAGWDPNP